VTFSPIAGATSTSLVVSATSMTMSGEEFAAVFSNPLGTAMTDAATLTVLPPGTHLAVVAPSSTTAGVPFTLTVTAEDGSNNVVPGYTGTVQLTSTDSKAVVPAGVTITNGAGSFNATLETAGSQTITVTDSANPSITGTTSLIIVTPAGATHFAFSGLPISVPPGGTFTFTVTALDPFDNAATAYTGTVDFTASSSLVSLPASGTLPNGAGTFAGANLGAVTFTITATDSTNSSITGTSPPI
jgi:hypothetical protein